jgi:hypothetical protein
LACALVVAPLVACEKNTGSAGCGIDALTGPLAVKQSFAQGGMVTVIPDAAPKSLPVRLVAGPAWRGTIDPDGKGRWQVTTHGSLPKEVHVGYGVVVFDGHYSAVGVLAFEGRSIRSATDLGTLVIGDSTVPLLGVRIDPAAIQNARCPLFPDSLR